MCIYTRHTRVRTHTHTHTFTVFLFIQWNVYACTGAACSPHISKKASVRWESKPYFCFPGFGKFWQRALPVFALRHEAKRSIKVNGKYAESQEPQKPRSKRQRTMSLPWQTVKKALRLQFRSVMSWRIQMKELSLSIFLKAFWCFLLRMAVRGNRYPNVSGAACFTPVDCLEYIHMKISSTEVIPLFKALALCVHFFFFLTRFKN